MSVTNTGFFVIQERLGAADDAVVCVVNSFTAVGVQIVGTFVGTVTFEGTIDNATWVALSLGASATGTGATTATAAGLWLGNCGGLYAVRARCSAYTSGTMYISFNVGR